MSPSNPSPFTRSDEIRFNARFDPQGRVLVHVHLDGTQQMEAVEKILASLNGNILSRIENYRHGIIAAYLPVERIEMIAGLAGVSHLTAEHPPKAWVGKVTSESTVVLRTNKVNALGIRGDGITVGVLPTVSTRRT